MDFRSIIDDYINEYDNSDKNYLLADRALAQLFGLYRRNSKAEDVLLKVIAINSLYSTQIKNTDLIPLSEHICNIRNLDLLLDEGNIDVVYLIGKTTDDINSAYVFASKYCHFHNPSSFAIFDSYSWLTLSEISNQYSFSEILQKSATKDFDSYKRFINCLNEFIARFNINKSYKDVDKYLWLYGKTLFNQAAGRRKRL